MPKPEMVIVKPSPNLPEGQYVRGVAAAGTALPHDEAQALIKAGLVVVVKAPPEPQKESI